MSNALLSERAYRYVVCSRFSIVFPLLLIFFSIGVTNCSAGVAGGKMPLRPKVKSIDTSSEGIGIFVFNLENHNKERIIPRIGAVHILDGKGDEVVTYRPKKKSEWNWVGAKGDMLSPIQVISVQLPAGRYSIGKVRGYGMHTKGFSKGHMQGKWGFQLNHSFDIEAEKIVYLGRINGAIKKKSDDDKGSVARAGAPLIDAGIRNTIAGFSGSKLDYQFTNSYEKDMATVKVRFPWLDVSAIWDKAEVQESDTSESTVTKPLIKTNITAEPAPPISETLEPITSEKESDQEKLRRELDERMKRVKP